jgi:Tfp pilus assembly protein PilO
VDKNRLWIIGSVLVMVVVVALGWVVGIQPQLAATAIANDQRVSVEQANAAQQASLDKLKEDFKGIDKLNQELAALSKSVPSGTDVPDYVDQLDALASANHVTLKGLTVADAEAYTPVALVAPAAAAVPAAPAGSAAPTPAPTPTTAPAPVAAPGAPPVTNAKITAANFASLSVQITISGTYSDVLRFVNGLQTGTRLFLVSGVSTTAAKGSSAAVDSKAPAPGPARDRIVDGAISGLIYSIVTPTTPLAVSAG